MDVCYYITQIEEELDGAADYIKRAINCKKKMPERADSYAKMSDMELGHATSLVKMFEEDYKAASEDADDDEMALLESIHKSIVDMHAERAAKIKYMHETYSGK